MSTDFFSVLFDRDAETLANRLENLNVDMNQPVIRVYEENDYLSELPIFFIMEEIDASDDEAETHYLEQLLLFAAERTIPTKELLAEYFFNKPYPSYFRALEEMLKRYNGEKIIYNPYRQTSYLEVMLGYNKLNMTCPVLFGAWRTNYRVLPIEDVILSYVFSGDLEMLYIAELMKRHGSPEPSTVRTTRILRSMYQRGEQSDRYLTRPQDEEAVRRFKEMCAKLSLNCSF